MTQTNPAPTPAPVPAPAPVAEPLPPPPTPPAPPPAPVQTAAPEEVYQGGGFLKEFDWVEMGFLILGAVTMYLVIDHYRTKAKEDKDNKSAIVQLAQRQDKIEMNFNGLAKRIRR